MALKYSDDAEILNEVYSGSGDINSAKCARAGNIDYGDYTLSSDMYLKDMEKKLVDCEKLVIANEQELKNIRKENKIVAKRFSKNKRISRTN